MRQGRHGAKAKRLAVSAAAAAVLMTIVAIGGGDGQAQPRQTVPAVPSHTVQEIGAATDPQAPARLPATGPAFFGEPDAPRRSALATGTIVEVERGRGGRSLAFKLRLADGTVGYFKPEAVRTSTRWYAELTSYYLDRELGLGRAAPSVGRSIPWTTLRPTAEGDARISEIVVRDGRVRGALLWWIPERLRTAQLPRGWERTLRIEPGAFRSPYVAQPEYRRGAPTVEAGEAPALDTEARAAELSDMILFDYLTANHDRWGGNNTNVRTRGDGGPLLFLDNGAAWPPGPRQRPALLDERVETVQRFRRSTIEAIRRVDAAALERAVAEDPLAPFLTRRHLDGYEARRQHLLEHVAAVEAQHGDAAFPW